MQMTCPRSSASALPRLCVGFLTIVVQAFAVADVEFNRLNDCNEVSEVLRTLERAVGECGTAQGSIERSIRALTQGSNARPCFMKSPPVESLDGFRCIRSDYSNTQGLTCYRPVSDEVLRDYEASFDKKYSAQSSRYIAQARACPGSNGVASRAQETFLPPMVSLVAQHAFGFGVQYGDTQPASAMALHGYARTAPGLAKQGVDAIEYVAYATGLTAPLISWTRIGNWDVDLTPTPGLPPEYRTALRRLGLEHHIAGIDLTIRRAPLAPRSAKTPQLSAELRAIAMKELKINGFKEKSFQEFRELTGVGATEFARVDDSTPFGIKQFIKERRGASKISILLQEGDKRCTHDRQGGFFAFTIETEGNKDVEVDFGSIAVFIAAIGACASPAQGGRQYVENLVQDSRQLLLDALEHR